MFEPDRCYRVPANIQEKALIDQPKKLSSGAFRVVLHRGKAEQNNHMVGPFDIGNFVTSGKVKPKVLVEALDP